MTDFKHEDETVRDVKMRSVQLRNCWGQHKHQVNAQLVKNPKCKNAHG